MIQYKKLLALSLFCAAVLMPVQSHATEATTIRVAVKFGGTNKCSGFGICSLSFDNGKVNISWSRGFAGSGTLTAVFSAQELAQDQPEQLQAMLMNGSYTFDADTVLPADVSQLLGAPSILTIPGRTAFPVTVDGDQVTMTLQANPI